MTDNNAVDRLLYEACKENKESLLCFGPDFETIEREAAAKLRARKTARRRKAIMRSAVAAAATAALFVALNSVLFFVDFEPVKAYRADMRTMIFNLIGSDAENSPEAQVAKTAIEIKKIQPNVPFQIPSPYWLPDGYLFKALNVTQKNGSTDVEILYEGSSGKLEIHITNGPEPQDGAYEPQTLSGREVYVRSEQTPSGVQTDCYFHIEAGSLVRISGGIDIETASHLIAEIKP